MKNAIAKCWPKKMLHSFRYISTRFFVCVPLSSDKSKSINYELHNGRNDTVFLCALYAPAFCWPSKNRRCWRMFSLVFGFILWHVLVFVATISAWMDGRLLVVFCWLSQQPHGYVSSIHCRNCLTATHNFLFHERFTLFSTICWIQHRTPLLVYHISVYTCLRQMSSRIETQKLRWHITTKRSMVLSVE